MFFILLNVKITIFNYFVIFFSILFFVSCIPFQVTDEVVPSFLYKNFSNVPEDIFPSDFKISIFLVRIEGTLLYSIDSNKNQLIITLNDANTPTLEVEFNGKRTYVTFSKLCRCERCRYELFKIRIQIRDGIYLQCNDRDLVFHTMEKSQKLNKGYPIPIFNKTNPVKAHLWLVNTPYYGESSPIGAQLTGCIFGLWYKKNELVMESYGMNNKCNITCNKVICHDGQCLETYNKNPVCNCTMSFKNGPFCNATAGNSNYKLNQRLQFKAVKLSFKEVTGEFFNLSNKYITLRIFSSGKKLNIQVECNRTYVTEVTGTITDKYQESEENVMIIVFDDLFIDIKFGRKNIKWEHLRIPHIYDLRNEKFEQAIIMSGNGILDFVYKNDLKEMRWNKLDNKNNNTEQIYPISTKRLIAVSPSSRQESNANTTLQMTSPINVSTGKTVTPILSKSEFYQEIKRLADKVDSCVSSMMIVLGFVVSMFVVVLIFIIYQNKSRLCYHFYSH